MDSISALQVFVHVAETRSLVAAGRLLGVSASAVGKRIGALEADLGARLFHRSTRSIRLTSEGALLLERSRRILTEVEAARHELAQRQQGARGRLRISLPLIGEPFLTALARFKLAFPEIELELDFTDRQVDIIDEGFDAVIRSGEAPDSRLTARYLGAYRMMLVAAPAYLARHPMPHSAADLARHDCIQFRYPNTGKMQTWPLAAAGLAPDFALPRSVVCNNLEARIHFALAGVGIACLPDFAIRQHLLEGRLVHLLPDCVDQPGPFHLVWPSGKHPVPKLRTLIDFLQANLFAEPP